MNVASLELCKELHELSGWVKTSWLYFKAPSRANSWSLITSEGYWEAVKAHSGNELDTIPAYDLGYLLRKLPVGLGQHTLRIFIQANIGDGTIWGAAYALPTKKTARYVNTADTPEDAAAKLAIELWKQGVLGK